MRNQSTTEFAGFLRTYFVVGAAISALAIIQTQIQTEALLKLRTRYKWVLLMLILAVNLVAGAYVALRSPDGRPFWERWDVRRAKRATGIVLAATILLVPVPVLLYARADFFGRGIEGFFRLFWLFWWLALMQAAGVRLAFGTGWYRALSIVLVVDGIAAQLCTLGGGVSGYPFSMAQVRFHAPAEGTVVASIEQVNVVFELADGSFRLEAFACGPHGIVDASQEAYAEFCEQPAE